DVERVAERLLALGPKAVLIKGGGLAELRGRDYLLTGAGEGRWLVHAPIATPHTHGSGCTLGAAITAGRARGVELEAAVVAAKEYVEGGLRRALAIGGGQGPLCHWHGLARRGRSGEQGGIVATEMSMVGPMTTPDVVWLVQGDQTRVRKGWI
ncbi:MAG: bifunctional hydroxymethylpyrimidine kinase/phosphomethylpyrimidine kinase, partial [Cyanobium sp.]